MTRRLRMAGVGLCAFILPACSMFTGQTEESTQALGPNQVLINRPTAAKTSNLRQQIAEGKFANPPGTPVAAAAKPTADASKTVAYAPPESAMPSMPGTFDGKPSITSVKNEQTVTTPGPMDDPIAAQAMKTVPNPNVVALPDEPMRVPPWPTLNPMSSGTRPTQLPDLSPVDAAPAAANSVPTVTPVADTTPNTPMTPTPETVSAPIVEAPAAGQISTSLKVSDSAPAKVEIPPTAAPLPVNPAAQAAAENLLVQALRDFQANRPQEALEHLKHLDSTNQELLMYLMPLMVRLAEGSTNSLPPEELAMVIERLQTASSMLKSKATLRAERVCFCRGVRKFADLDPYEAGHVFKPGDMVFLYAELKNFTCEPVTGQKSSYNSLTRGCYIRLGTSLELRDARTNLIWRTDLQKNDYAQVPPQDYYHTYRFCVPDKLPAGSYTLWLNIVDKPTGRAVRQPVEMNIGLN